MQFPSAGSPSSLILNINVIQKLLLIALLVAFLSFFITPSFSQACGLSAEASPQILYARPGGEAYSIITLTGFGATPCTWEYEYQGFADSPDLAVDINPTNGVIITGQQLNSQLKITLSEEASPGTYLVSIILRAVCVQGSCEGTPTEIEILVEVVVEDEPPPTRPPSTPPSQPPPIQHPMEWVPPTLAEIAILSCPADIQVDDIFTINGETVVEAPSPTLFQLRIYASGSLIESLLTVFQGYIESNFSSSNYQALRKGEVTFRVELWSFNFNTDSWTLHDVKQCTTKFTPIPTILTIVDIEPEAPCLTEAYRYGLSIHVKLSQLDGDGVNGQTISLLAEKFEIKGVTDKEGIAALTIPAEIISRTPSPIRFSFEGSNRYGGAVLNYSLNLNPYILRISFNASGPAIPENLLKNQVTVGGQSGTPVGNVLIYELTQVRSYPIHIPDLFQVDEERRLKPKAMLEPIDLTKSKDCEMELEIVLEWWFLLTVKTPLPYSGEGWYPHGSEAEVKLSYSKEIGPGSRINLVGYLINGDRFDASRSAEGELTLTLIIDKPVLISTVEVIQHILTVNGGNNVMISPISPTGDGYYDQDMSVNISSQGGWNVKEKVSRRILTGYTLNGGWTPIERKPGERFTLKLKISKPTHIVFKDIIQYWVRITRVYVDEGLHEIISEDFYDEGSTPIIKTPGTIKGGEGVEYRLLGDTEDILESTIPQGVRGPVDLKLPYGTYLHVQVNSEYGLPYGSGWYRKNTEMGYGVSDDVLPLPARNLGDSALRLLGAIMELKGWVTENGETISAQSSGKMLVVKPEIITAVWEPNYLWPIIAGLLIGVTIGGGLSLSQIYKPCTCADILSRGCRKCRCLIQGPDTIKFYQEEVYKVDVDCPIFQVAENCGHTRGHGYMAHPHIKEKWKISGPRVELSSRGEGWSQIIVVKPSEHDADKLTHESYLTIEFETWLRCQCEENGETIEADTMIRCSKKVMVVGINCGFLKKRILEKEEEIREKARQIREKEKQIEEREENLQQKNKEIEKLQQEDRKLTQTVSQLQSQINNMDSQLTQLNNKLNGLQATLSTAQATYGQKLIEFKVIQHTFSEATKEVSKATLGEEQAYLPDQPGYSQFKKALEIQIVRKAMVAVGYGLARVGEVMMKGLPSPTPSGPIEQAIHSIIKEGVEYIKPQPGTNIEKIVGKAVQGLGKTIKDFTSLDQLEALYYKKKHELMTALQKVRDIEGDIQRLSLQAKSLENKLNQLRQELSDTNKTINQHRERLKALLGEKTRIEQEIRRIRLEVSEAETGLEEARRELEEMQALYNRECKGR